MRLIKSSLGGDETAEKNKAFCIDKHESSQVSFHGIAVSTKPLAHKERKFFAENPLHLLKKW